MPCGTVCPNCGQPVMPYKRFIREAEPTRISRCSHCNVELRRKRSVWVLLGVGVGILAAGLITAGVVHPFVPHDALGIGGMIAALIVILVVWTLAVNICGWLFVGWDLAAPPQPAAGSGEDARTRSAAQGQ